MFGPSPLSMLMNNNVWLITLTSSLNSSTPKSMSDPQVIRGNCLKHDGRGSNVPHYGLYSPSNGIVPTLPMHAFYTLYYTKKFSFLPLANKRLRSSTVGRRLYSAPKHTITPLQNSLRHSKVELFPFWCTHRWSQQHYHTQACVGSYTLLVGGETTSGECIGSKSEVAGELTLDLQDVKEYAPRMWHLWWK
jgi:hypothetical protein